MTDTPSREKLLALADSWDVAAERIGDRALWGDPSSSLAQAQALRSCAAGLRAILNGQEDLPADPQPIANETESGYARRRELVAEARKGAHDD